MTVEEKFARMPIQRGKCGEDIGTFSDTELLAVVLGTGCRGLNVMQCAESLLHNSGGIKGLFNAGLREIAAHSGVGIAKAVRIKCALEMGRRILSVGEERADLCNPRSVWMNLLPIIAGLQHEVFIVLVVNSSNGLIKQTVVSQGTVNQSLVHPREVFREAIKEGGSGIIIAHNHPSGVLTPSAYDLTTTEKIKQAGDIIGIPLLDHVIVTEKDFYSLKAAGHF